MNIHRSGLTVAITVCALASMTVGVAAQVDVEGEGPTGFTGRLVCGPDARSGSTEQGTLASSDGEIRSQVNRGYAWLPSATMSDPRLDGVITVSYDWDEYQLPGSSDAMRVGSETWRIENDDGAWEGSLTNAFLADRSTAAGSAVLVGEDAYEGLSVIWEELVDWSACAWDVRGLIVEGGAPAAPEAAIVD